MISTSFMRIFPEAIATDEWVTLCFSTEANAFITAAFVFTTTASTPSNRAVLPTKTLRKAEATFSTGTALALGI